MNYRDIKPKRDKNITLLKFVMSDRAPEILLFQAFVWEKDGSSQDNFPVLLK